MKKVIALILVIATLLTLSVTAFAASPSADAKYKVTLAGAGTIEDKNNTNNGAQVKKDSVEKTVAITVDADGHIVATVCDESGVFTGWKIYKAASTGTGKVGLANTVAINPVAAAIKFTEATPNVDYLLISGNLKSKTIVVEPRTDLIICANYNNVPTDPATGKPVSETSPETSDLLIVYASVAMLAVLSVAFIAKKKIKD